MCFRLVYGDFELQVTLPFEGHVEERLYRLITQGDISQEVDRSRNEISRRIVEHITMMLEGEMLPPTDKQLKYAVAIARELSLELPVDVLQYRNAMAIFLGTHAEQYRRRKGYNNPARASET